MNAGNCRFCQKPLKHKFVDLGMSPLANSYLAHEDLACQEATYPLCVYICHSCFLVQLPEHKSPDFIFTDYAFFSSYSDKILELSKVYCNEIASRLNLNSKNLVIEIASNDGYLLKNFKTMGIPILGIEPAKNVAEVAQDAGIPTLVKFFGTKTASELSSDGKQADLLIGNNVLAHVPDLNDFVQGLKIALKPHGVISIEFPHLLTMLDKYLFDLIYHEHFSYFSFTTVEKILEKHNLNIFDIDFVPTHGGSLRILGKHIEDNSKTVSQKVFDLREKEKRANIKSLDTYQKFSSEVKKIKQNFTAFILQAKEENKSIAAYGAPAKGNTFLNYCKIKSNTIEYTVDRNPHKQGKYLPGTHIPIHHPDQIKKTRPNYLLILPWNLKDEIMEQMSFIKEWGGQFVIPLPKLSVVK
jgi:SAM-dependent methyltransferase